MNGRECTRFEMVHLVVDSKRSDPGLMESVYLNWILTVLNLINFWLMQVIFV